MVWHFSYPCVLPAVLSAPTHQRFVHILNNIIGIIIVITAQLCRNQLQDPLYPEPGLRCGKVFPTVYSL